MLLFSRFNHVRLVNPERGERSDTLFSTSSSTVRWVNPDNGDTPDTELLLSVSRHKLVNPDNGDTSDIEFWSSPRSVRLNKRDSGHRLDIELPIRSSDPRLVACSNPVKLLMLASRAVSEVKVSISATVMVAPAAFAKGSLNRSAEVRIGDVDCLRWVKQYCNASALEGGDVGANGGSVQGFPLASTSSPLPNPVFDTSDERSDMLLLLRYSHVRLVNPNNGDTSDTEFSLSSN